MKLSNNKSILLKVYLKNCLTSNLNFKTIFQIIYNKNIFSANNSWQKIRTLNEHGIL